VAVLFRKWHLWTPLCRRPGHRQDHVATALGVQAVEHHRKRVRFFSTVELVNTLEQEKAQSVLALMKTVSSVTDTNGNGVNDAGDVIHWTFLVENTGTAAATNVTVTDTVPGVVLTGGPIASLAADASDATTFAASYEIQASDVPGDVVNSATATADVPRGNRWRSVYGGLRMTTRSKTPDRCLNRAC
jgi:uncharacterized repeat protein (TIGR01451 family)